MVNAGRVAQQRGCLTSKHSAWYGQVQSYQTAPKTATKNKEGLPPSPQHRQYANTTRVVFFSGPPGSRKDQGWHSEHFPGPDFTSTLLALALEKLDV